MEKSQSIETSTEVLGTPEKDFTAVTISMLKVFEEKLEHYGEHNRRCESEPSRMSIN